MLTSIPFGSSVSLEHNNATCGSRTRPCSKSNHSWFHCNNLQQRNYLPERSRLATKSQCTHKIIATSFSRMKVSSKYFTNLLVRESSPIITNREVRFKTSRKVNIPRFPVTSSNVSIIRITVVFADLTARTFVSIDITG